MFLDTLEERNGVVERLAVTRSTGIFRQSIDHKANGIELLLGVEGVAFGIDTPIHTAILRIEEMVENIVLGTCGSSKVGPPYVPRGGFITL